MRRPVFLTRESRRCLCCGSVDAGSDGSSGEGAASVSVCSGTDGCAREPLVGEVGYSIEEAVEARRGTQRLCFDKSESILRFAPMDTRAWTTDRARESSGRDEKLREFGSAGITVWRVGSVVFRRTDGLQELITCPLFAC